jgi:phosphoglycerol transferase
MSMGADRKTSRLRIIAGSAVIPPVLAAVVALGVTVWRLGLWHFDLRVPVVYWGDALYETTLVKALTEQTWNYYIDRLGAPFGMPNVDFPIGCTFDFAIIKLLSFVIHNGCLLINVYWLLSLGLAAAFATLFLRSLRLRVSSSVCFGILYALIPFGFYRSISHLDLVHFLVPAGAYLAMSLCNRRTPEQTQTCEVAEFRDRRKLWLLRVTICVAIGLSFAYWAFFACIVIALCALLAFVFYRNVRVLGLAALYIVVIGSSDLLGISASFLYWHQHGHNKAMDFKYAAEADVYALTTRGMLTPIVGHPFPPWAALRHKIAAAKFPNDANESLMAALGTIGSVGFLVLLLIAVLRPRYTMLADTRLLSLAAVSLGIVLIAGSGGFGSLFNALVIKEFRCYNRISPYLSLFSFAALGIILDKAISNKSRLLRYAVLTSFVVFASFDQVPATLYAERGTIEKQFYLDDKFVRAMEADLPKGAMVFQLPHIGFPLDAGQYKINVNDNARAYLHSHSLRWSWGNIDGRNNDWPKKVAALPLPEFLRAIIRAGFEGLLIDRYGYVDTKLESEVRDDLGSPPKIDHGDRWVFFDLRGVRPDQVKANSTPRPPQLESEIAPAEFPTPSVVYLGKPGADRTGPNSTPDGAPDSVIQLEVDSRLLAEVTSWEIDANDGLGHWVSQKNNAAHYWPIAVDVGSTASSDTRTVTLYFADTGDPKIALFNVTARQPTGTVLFRTRVSTK